MTITESFQKIAFLSVLENILIFFLSYHVKYSLEKNRGKGEKSLRKESLVFHDEKAVFSDEKAVLYDEKAVNEIETLIFCLKIVSMMGIICAIVLTKSGREHSKTKLRIWSCCKLSIFFINNIFVACVVVIFFNCTGDASLIALEYFIATADTLNVLFVWIVYDQFESTIESKSFILKDFSEYSASSPDFETFI